MKFFLLILILLLCQPSQASACLQNLISNDTIATAVDSSTQLSTLKMDTTSGIKQSDSLTTKVDSIAVDSIRVRFLPGMGQITNHTDTTKVFYQTQVLWSDAKYASELFWKLPGFFYRDLGEAGKQGELNAFGIDGRGIGILLDGRPMNDPVNGTYNLSDLPLEFLDNAEIFSGSSVFMTSSKAVGAAINFVSRSYNSYRPLTKLRFVQDPKGTLITDGLFTQNVARGLNLMIGFQRQVSLGRFTNADLDGWNIRTRLRYNISDRLNISLTDFFIKADNGLNNGVNNLRSSNIFDENEAIVINKFAWDSRARHDVTLSTIARILSDSSSTTQINLYYSKLEREYWDGSLIGKTDSTKSSYWGVRLQQQIILNPFYFTLGGGIERRLCDSTRTLTPHIQSEKSLFAQTELRLLDFFVPSISLRSTSLDGESTFGSGMGVKSSISNWFTAYIDASWYDRFPTFQEQFWRDDRDSAVVRLGNISKEQHAFIQGGFTVNPKNFLKINLSAFERKIKNAIVYQPILLPSNKRAINILNVDKVVVVGINGSVAFNWRQFEALGVMTLTRYKEADTIKTLIPDIVLSAEASYRDKFFNEKLEVKFGVRTRFNNRQQSMQFDPQTLSFVQYRANIMGRSTTLDLFMVLKIGAAHISLSWNNLLNAGYLFSPIYPMPQRHIRLGVHWVFLD